LRRSEGLDAERRKTNGSALRLGLFRPALRQVDIALDHGATPGPGDKSHDPEVSIGVVGLVLSVASAWAADFSAELDFVTRASNSNLFAIEESRLALDRSGDAQVKTFARRLVEDHESAEAELQAAAEGSGAAVPTALDEEHQARLTALRGGAGTDFDEAYVADQGENHSNALTLYGDTMLWGEYEKLRALAIKMIPITEAQLKDAQVLARD
jgi:putative membrane protein